MYGAKEDTTESNGTEMSIHIDRVVLGMQQVAVRRSNQEFLYIPVWKCDGRVQSFRDGDADVAALQGKEASSQETESMRASIPIEGLNAVDGSVVDGITGY